MELLTDFSINIIVFKIVDNYTSNTIEISEKEKKARALDSKT
ncbi:14011_t:CDS:2 [Cetraspora pellucida]|uniref:14011_t:CDS:1 n=1 Tax=Cetraspora pellucida TaxID=1433469 RepID=A0A9N8VY31_9GLOM|nr:14011_t:CDS:2 [Cetraspora pellucida]